MGVTIQDNTRPSGGGYGGLGAKDWGIGASPAPPQKTADEPWLSPEDMAYLNSPTSGPTGPSGPAPATPVQGNPLFNFLSALFGNSGGRAAQGMTGMLQQRGQAGAGTNNLGNPFRRF